jgi:hypothetical protein
MVFKPGLIETIAIAAIPIYLIGFGLRGILTKKAYVVSTRRLLWVVIILFVPLFLSQGGFISGSRKHAFNFMDLFPLVFVGVIFLVSWKTRGYSISGATEEYLQSALRASLQKLNLPFEESVARLRLTSLDADLFVSVTGFGPALMRLKQHRHDSTLKQIADYMNVYFATVPGKVDMTAFYVSAVLGAWLLFQQLPLILKIIS